MIRMYIMGEKGYQILSHVVKNNLAPYIKDIVYGCDKNVLNDFSEQINSLCVENSIHVYERGNQPEYNGWSLAISWRWLIPDPDNLIVFHDSILPRYRGFSPLVTALKNGDPEIGVTAILASEKYDEGKIISQATTKINYPIRIKDAIKKTIPLYYELADEIIRTLWSDNNLPTIEQDSTKASYSLWLDASDYFISWNLSSAEIERHVNATGDPYLGAKTYIEDEIFTVYSGIALDDVVIENRSPGKVIFVDGNYPVVVCAKGLFKITELKTINDKNALPLKKFRSRFR